MPEIKIAPYGSWQSPITSDLIVSETVRLSDIVLDGRDIYWVEMRPSEGGRYVIVRGTPDGQITDITPSEFNVRTRVHEYGGRSFAVDGTHVYFSNYADQHIYCQTPDSDPVPVASGTGLRFADIIVDRRRRSLICVCEDHSNPQTDPENKLIRLGLKNGGEPGSRSLSILASGSDFYSSPSLSRDGSQLAWLQWNHPNMPWDGTELWVGRLAGDGTLQNMEKVAGGTDESIFQPRWSPDGTLYFVSDRSGWWNIYRREENQVKPVLLMEAEFGVPQWLFGMSTYAFESAQHLICAYAQNGSWRLADIDLATDDFNLIETPYTDIAYLRAAPGRAVFVGGAATEPTSIVRLDLTNQLLDVLRRSNRVDIDAGFISNPQTVEFPTAREETAHAFFYAPRNKNYQAPAGERAPLVVISHGGPTASAMQSLNLAIQYWTSRGVAVLDVNYGGSTGYGRAYRQRLNGQWGIVDTEDCLNGAGYAVENFGIDQARLIIRGSSAGGYTTLCALVFHDTFRAGASYYGVSDLEALAQDTHKFEARYLDKLIGPYPERKDLYVARSPIHHAARLACPIIFFQGLEDEVVPPGQAEMMVAILREKKLPVAYITFEKEQHGFRMAQNIKRALDAELYFYSRIFGFQPADEIEPVEIENL
ncbi:MAG: S9 family peptidase [Desulfobacterales bacterium]|nr:MAG: S9 family peptidase [Desulfobacterales bacterium]